jgi:nicotinate-nucleotide--dimethylbenzimidazole phosphoribosyltransferase
MLNNKIDTITNLDNNLINHVQKRLDNLTKPLGSLGKLEELVKQVAGINNTPNPSVDKKAIVVMCADNGVVDEGVSSCPKSVTAAVTRNFTKGITGVCVFSKLTGADLVIVDIGVDDDIKHDMILDKKIRRGTANMVKGPAMTREEAELAINTGIEIVGELKLRGINLLGTGEMGIGNTTTSSAVSAVLTGAPVEKLVGKGSGLSSEAYQNKIQVVKKAIEINKPNPEDPVDVLTKVGGLDIAGLVGCFLGAAIYRIPILIDGFISASAALIAIRIKPEVKNFIFSSHGSAEPGNLIVMEALGMEPMLNLGMRLGEGTGAALGFQVFDAAFAAYYQMGTFEDATIEQYVPQE